MPHKNARRDEAAPARLIIMPPCNARVAGLAKLWVTVARLDPDAGRCNAHHAAHVTRTARRSSIGRPAAAGMRRHADTAPRVRCRHVPLAQALLQRHSREHFVPEICRPVTALALIAAAQVVLAVSSCVIASSAPPCSPVRLPPPCRGPTRRSARRACSMLQTNPTADARRMHNDIMFTLFVVFVAAQIGGEISQRLHLPGVVGEIAAGCVIGPSLLGWISIDQIAPGTALDVLAEIGVVLLLFSVGLETRLEDLKKVGAIAFLVGLVGVVVPFLMGSVWAHGNGFDWARSMFVAAAFVATSAGITARVLQELNALQRIESKVILGAAVIDDVLAMLLLGVVVSMQRGGAFSATHLLLVLAGAIGFIAVIGWGGTRVMRWNSAWLDKPKGAHSPLMIVLALCLGLAWVSTLFGLAAIIGAFLAGMVASETRQRESLEKKTMPLLALLTPFFFVVTGSKIDLHELASVEALWMLGVVTLIAVISKFIGGWLGAISLGPQSATIIGTGMVPRGEVGIVVATLGLAAGAFDNRIYAIIVAMSLLTSVVTPPILAWLLKRPDARANVGKEPPPQIDAPT